MKKKSLKQESPIVPQGMVLPVNGEAAPRGTACRARNVRECEQSLQVTGSPAVAGAVGLDDRLLLLADGHRVTCHGTTIKIDNVAVTTMTGTVVGAHSIGDVIVIVTDTGLTYLRQHEGEWISLDPVGGLPAVTLSATSTTQNIPLESYAFADSYRQWQAPLLSSDVAGLTSLLRTAWNAFAADVESLGRYSAPLLARWGVRLLDDSYLWLSEPVRLGDATLSNVDRVTVPVTSDSTGVTGTDAAMWPLTHYGLDITVTRDIAPEWLPLIKSIDVLVTRQARLLTSNPVLEYRCLTRTTGGREQVLEMGLSRRAATAVARDLSDSPWQLVATAAVAAHVTCSDFVAPGETVSLTPSQCAAIGRLPSLSGVTGSASAGGRLYCCTRDGEVVVSNPGNALVEAHRRSVLGASPLALAVVTKPLYAGGFGRYPIYVFTDDGIYAIPQRATGTLGEARLVDRTVIAADVAPVEAWRDVWFVSRHGHLCRLSGAQVTVAQRSTGYRGLAWCAAHDELWLLPASGYPVVLMPSGAMSERTVAARQLYSDPRHAVAVTDDGTVLDLEREQAATQPVSWCSHPIALSPLLGAAVGRVVWHVAGQEADLTLRVTGRRGIRSQEHEVSAITVTGDIDQPLAAPAVRWPVRSVLLEVTGTARSGTLLLPTILYL